MAGSLDASEREDFAHECGSLGFRRQISGEHLGEAACPPATITGQELTATLSRSACRASR
jgi:hypothetical protein